MTVIDKESYERIRSLKSMIKLMYDNFEWFQGCSANLEEETISIFHSEIPKEVSNLLPSTVNGFSILLKNTGTIEAYEKT